MTSSDRLDTFGRGPNMTFPTGVGGGVAHEDSFFSEGRLFGMGAVGLSLLFALIFMRKVPIFWLIYIPTIIFILRFLVFNEAWYRSVIKDCHFGEPFVDAELTGVLNYGVVGDGAGYFLLESGKVCMCLEVVRDSLVGRGANFKEFLFSCESDALQFLLKAGYEVEKSSLMFPGHTDRRLENIYPNVGKCAVGDLLEEQHTFTLRFASGLKYERVIWFVYTDSVGELDVLYDDLRHVLHDLHQGFVRSRIIPVEDIKAVADHHLGVRVTTMAGVQATDEVVKPVLCGVAIDDLYYYAGELGNVSSRFHAVSVDGNLTDIVDKYCDEAVVSGDAEALSVGMRTTYGLKADDGVVGASLQERLSGLHLE